MNRQYLIENNLLEAHNQFMKLAEAYMPLQEELYEDEDPNAMPPEGDPNAMGGDPNTMPPEDSDPNAMGGDPNAMPPEGDPNAMGGDPNAMPPEGGDPNAMPPMGDPSAMGSDPNTMPPMDGPIPPDEPEDDDSTIDIDALTKAQEKLDVKQNHVGQDLGKVDNKINSLVDTVDKLMKMIDAQNATIETFKQEFEKRNPTQTEKLNLRSLDSYPFNVTPDAYWENKTKDSNYVAYGNNDEPTTQEYEITNNDVDDYESDIANTFYKIDDDDVQTLDKIFKL